MLSIPLLSSSALLSGSVMPTEPLRLPHNIYSCGSWMLITRDYFALILAPLSCCTEFIWALHVLSSLSTLLLEWCFCSRYM